MLVADQLGQFHIHHYHENGFTVNNQSYDGCIEVASHIAARQVAPISLAAWLQQLCHTAQQQSHPVVIIGCGATQYLLPATAYECFHQQGIGLEIMTTPAACRTFNALSSQHQPCFAALAPLTHTLRAV